MAKAQQPEKPSFWGQLKQIGTVFKYTAKRDRLFVILVVAEVVLTAAAVTVVVVLGGGLLWIPIGIMFALVALMMTLNFSSRRAVFAEAEGQPGAAVSIIQTIRGDWRVHPAVAATVQQDMVHVVIGRAGVILLGEGDPNRVRHLIAQERRRLIKVIGRADLRDYIIGKGEGEVPISKLQMTLVKLPRTLKVPEINALDTRLKALSTRPQLPKGAIPKNMRPPKMRGAGRPR